MPMSPPPPIPAGREGRRAPVTDQEAVPERPDPWPRPRDCLGSTGVLVGCDLPSRSSGGGEGNTANWHCTSCFDVDWAGAEQASVGGCRGSGSVASAREPRHGGPERHAHRSRTCGPCLPGPCSVIDIQDDACGGSRGHVTSQPCWALCPSRLPPTSPSPAFLRRSLDLTGPLLLGGVPNLPEDFPVRSRQFVGCMRNLSIDGRSVDMAGFIANNGTRAGRAPPPRPGSDVPGAKPGVSWRERSRAWGVLLSGAGVLHCEGQ